VAGTFYPLDAAELRRAVTGFVEGCPRSATVRQPRALIVPHAGYAYSGSVAGCAYRRLRDAGARIRHVVLLGPTHRVPLRGLAVSSFDGFETPLGTVPIDVAGRQRLREPGSPASPTRRTPPSTPSRYSCRSCSPYSTTSTCCRSPRASHRRISWRARSMRCGAATTR
jgi:AmmeMemoRadiSam system protein B